MVIIEKMPFARVTPHAFVLIETVVRWVSQFDSELPENGRLESELPAGDLSRELYDAPRVACCGDVRATPLAPRP